MFRGTWVWLLLLLSAWAPLTTYGQIDPAKRRLIQLGYNQPIEGKAPIAAYGFFYLNEPDFFSTNLTLRLAIAPIYIDSELGISRLIGPHTDLAIGLAGGGFGDSYGEIRHGVYEQKESFSGDGGELSSSIYHLFNPGQTVPLNLIVRGSIHQTYYRRDSETSDAFDIPDDRTTFHIRAGLRLGGEEPSMTEPAAMELSIWQETRFRLESDSYGFQGDRKIEAQSYLLWGRALFKYALDPSEQMIQASLSAGQVWHSDRFSAYRLGGVLPFSSEFPLSIPGYFFQELSAQRFALLSAQYSVPLVPSKSWRVDILGATGWVDYVDGLEQPGNWHSGAGAGVTYISPAGSWLVSLLYGYGFDAMRTEGRGANQIAFLFQYDFEAKARGKSRFFVPGMNPYRSRGAEEIFRR